MDQDKVKFIIDMINNMELKDKLRLAIRMSDSNYTNLKYDKPEMYEIFDNKLFLKLIDCLRYYML